MARSPEYMDRRRDRSRDRDRYRKNRDRDRSRSGEREDQRSRDNRDSRSHHQQRRRSNSPKDVRRETYDRRDSPDRTRRRRHENEEDENRRGRAGDDRRGGGNEGRRAATGRERGHRDTERIDPNRIKIEPREPGYKPKGPVTNPDLPEEKQGPDFGTSGKLLEDTNVFNGVVIKYSEPPEAKKPTRRWRFYVFKGDESLPTLHLHRQSAFLLGKDRKIVDIPIDHPSCSRQHAVLQYRSVSRDGRHRILPYIIDLGSSNGTYLNNNRIDAQKYHELREQDVLKFGYSSREYVLLHDQSKGAIEEEEEGS